MTCSTGAVGFGGGGAQVGHHAGEDRLGPTCVPSPPSLSLFSSARPTMNTMVGFERCGASVPRMGGFGGVRGEAEGLELADVVAGFVSGNEPADPCHRPALPR